MLLVDSVSAVDESLKLSIYQAELQAEVGYWNNLQKLRGKATTKQGLQDYRRLLERGIARLHQRRADVLDNAGQERAAQEFLGWLNAERERLGISNVERDRGRSVEQWCEKWASRAFTSYQAAFKTMCEKPSGEALAKLKDAATAMLEAFANPPDNAS